jgi:hypothetical protein
MRDIGQKVYNLIFKQKVVAAPISLTFPSLSHSWRRSLLEIQCNNYALIMICINNNNNNAIITNRCGSLQDLILFFKISMGKRKNFFGICRKFGHAPSKKFASLAGDFFLTSRQTFRPTVSEEMTESLQKNDQYVEPGYSQNQRVAIFMVRAYAIHLTSSVSSWYL